MRSHRPRNTSAPQRGPTTPAPSPRVPCTSSKPGDFAYRACAPFCKPLHCAAWCKCGSCPFCRQRAHAAPTNEGNTAARLQQTSLNEANARIAGLEKQLELCRHSAAALRSAGGGGGQRRGTTSDSVPRAGPGPRGMRSNSAAACSDAIEWAQSVGLPLHPDLYPGLNESSTRFELQLHLHRYDPSARCSHPLGGRMEGSAGVSLPLLLGVALLSLCAASILGYIPPSRRLRGWLRWLGVAPSPLVR